MHFVKTERLVGAHRLAQPYYTRRGEEQYKAGMNIDGNIIAALKANGLPGAYVYEPTETYVEPSDEAKEYNRFLAVNSHVLMMEILEAVKTHRLRKLESLADDIIEKYALPSKKADTISIVRNRDSFIYIHSVNTAIIAALIMGKLGYGMEEKRETVWACLIHDIGKTIIPPKLIEDETEDELLRILSNCQDTGFELIDTLFPENPGVKDICVQSQRILKNLRAGREMEQERVLKGTEVMLVSEVFEEMTALSIAGDAKENTAVAALKYFYDHPEIFNKRVVKALTDTFSIISVGTSVVLSNGSKALVMSENNNNILCPVVLEFSTNKMIDLSDKAQCGDLMIVNAVTNTDDRYSMR